MMPIVSLSITESELYTAVQCAQDIFFILKLLLSLGLEVKLHMILEIDNHDTFNFVQGWSVNDRCCHINVKEYFFAN